MEMDIVFGFCRSEYTNLEKYFGSFESLFIFYLIFLLGTIIYDNLVSYREFSGQWKFLDSRDIIKVYFT